VSDLVEKMCENEFHPGTWILLLRRIVLHMH